MVDFHSFSHMSKIGALAAFFVAAYVQPYRVIVITGRSMEPTFHNHAVLVTKPVVESELKRGMVVLVDSSDGPIVKRIALLPGDRYPQASIGGGWYDYPYGHPPMRAASIRFKWRYATVPAGTAYVLGDNAYVSYDSREFGPVPFSRIRRQLL